MSAPKTGPSTFVRALFLLAAIGSSVGSAVASVVLRPSLSQLILQNELDKNPRTMFLNITFAPAVAAGALGALYVWARRSGGKAPWRLEAFARALSPLTCAAFFPWLFHAEIWRDRPLLFLVMVALFVFLAQKTTRVALGSFRALGSLADNLRAIRGSKAAPLLIVAGAALAYVLYFSYYTICFHYSVRSGFDLGIKNNIFWNTLHGTPFKASPTLGPHGPSHFGRHSDLLVYFLLPIYYFHQQPETILVLQSLFTGVAAIPLYLLCARHAGRGAAVFIALAYLLHPAIHGANLFEFHFVLFGLPLLWTGWWLLERHRNVAGVIFLALTLFTREDVALWVVILGLYFLFAGARPRAGLVTAAVGLVFFIGVKFVWMPMISGDESFSSIYAGLIGPGEKGFSGVLETVASNPVFVLSTLMREAKVLYLLQIFVPLAFLPLFAPAWPVLAIPGFVLTILSPTYSPVYDIHFQYSPHWIAFMAPGAALALQRMTRGDGRNRIAALVGLACGTLPVSYQFGAIFQQHTAFGGPIAFVFGIDDEGQRRHEAIADLATLMPADAKVACSAFATPQFSSRADAYDMNQGFFDAEYLVFPTQKEAFIANEKQEITARLSSAAFGVVKIHPPFALAKRGHPTLFNAELLDQIR